MKKAPNISEMTVSYVCYDPEEHIFNCRCGVMDYLDLELECNPVRGTKVILWYEEGLDRWNPSVIAWPGHMEDVKYWLNEDEFLKKKYNFDPVTRAHFNKYKREYLRDKKRATEIAKIDMAIKILQSVKVPRTSPTNNPQGYIDANLTPIIVQLRTLKKDILVH